MCFTRTVNMLLLWYIDSKQRMDSIWWHITGFSPNLFQVVWGVSFLQSCLDTYSVSGWAKQNFLKNSKFRIELWKILNKLVNKQLHTWSQWVHTTCCHWYNTQASVNSEGLTFRVSLDFEILITAGNCAVTKSTKKF